MTAKRLALVTPGEVLLEEFIKPFGISQYQVAKDIGVPPRRINEIVLGKRVVTADTALRLARYFSTSERFWLNLQARHDLEAEKDRLGCRLRKEVRVLAGGAVRASKRPASLTLPVRSFGLLLHSFDRQLAAIWVDRVEQAPVPPDPHAVDGVTPFDLVVSSRPRVFP